jgi:hypothetical protein
MSGTGADVGSRVTQFISRARTRRLAGMANAVQSPSSDVEAIRFSADDMAPRPTRWADQGAPAMRLFFWWGYVHVPGRRPILLMRASMPMHTLIYHHEVGAGI